MYLDLVHTYINMKGYFNTYNICTYIIIRRINININFIYKINFKNKTIYTKCPLLNNTLRFFKNHGRYGKIFQMKVVFDEGHKKVPLI